MEDGCGAVGDLKLRDIEGGASHWGRNLPHKSHERARVRGRRRLVHEIDVNLPPSRLVEPSRPSLEILIGIGFQTKTHVAPRRGLDERRGFVVLPLRVAQRRASRFQGGVDLVVEPGVVAEFECSLVSRREDRKEVGEPREVLVTWG